MAITGNEMESVTLGTGQVLVRADGSLQARLYDPESNSWSDAGVQSVTRSMPSMTLLADGQLLLAGGSNEKSAELYDPQTRTWTPTASMSVARRAHAAVLMHDGRVLVASGFNNSSGEVPSAEIYDPVAGTWSPAAPPLVPRHYASMNLLPDGRLLLAGGFTAAGVTNHAELYDPVANTWTATGALNHPRDSMMGYLSAHSTVLPSRKVLLAGGSDGARNPQPVAEVYDPATGTWSIADAINPARENGTASLLPSGEVLITGGHSSNPSTAFYANTDRYQPPVPANNLAVLDSLPLLQRRGGTDFDRHRVQGRWWHRHTESGAATCREWIHLPDRFHFSFSDTVRVDAVAQSARRAVYGALDCGRRTVCGRPVGSIHRSSRNTLRHSGCTAGRRKLDCACR